MLQFHRNGILISQLRGRFLQLFSTSTAAESPNSLADYLVNSVGFTMEEAIATSLKVRYPNSTRNPNSVVDLFKLNGFNDTQIRKIVSRDPLVLRSDVEKTLIPKFRVLQGLGLSPSDLGDLFGATQSVFFTKISAQKMQDAIDFLTPIFGIHDVVKFLRTLRGSFSVDIATRNLTVLHNLGVSAERIRRFFVHKRVLLQLNPKNFEEICGLIEDKLGISVESSAFLQMVAVLASCTAETLSRKYEVFRSYGWTKSYMDAMIRKYPQSLMLSQVLIERKLEYFMKEVGLEAGYIASNPSLLGYSLEKRVFRRNAVLQVLKERKLISASFGLARAVQIGESQFLNEFVLPYEDELPGLFEAYSNNIMDSFIKS